jgi:hypothetical protein
LTGPGSSPHPPTDALGMLAAVVAGRTTYSITSPDLTVV